MEDLEDQAQKQRSAASSHYEELLQARTRLDGYNSKFYELESSLASAQAANKDLKVSMSLVFDSLDFIYLKSVMFPEPHRRFGEGLGPGTQLACLSYGLLSGGNQPSPRTNGYSIARVPRLDGYSYCS